MTDRERWIEDIQLFQKIAGVSVESDEVLGEAWDDMMSSFGPYIMEKPSEATCACSQ